jgi:hypothetical protein
MRQVRVGSSFVVCLTESNFIAREKEEEARRRRILDEVKHEPAFPPIHAQTQGQ